MEASLYHELHIYWRMKSPQMCTIDMTFAVWEWTARIPWVDGLV